MIPITKLAAIYNVWDGVELLRGSIQCLKEHVDLIIVVYQNISNFGEPYAPLPEMGFYDSRIIYEKYTPVSMGGTHNEQNKRNIGLRIAREHGCSHFLHMDVDEYYEDFGMLKAEYIENRAAGSVCNILTYFKKPTWRLKNVDGYYVPFIHRLSNHTTAGYGFEGKFYCDPTRIINEADVVVLLSQPMHHFSWVRNDIERKARNSTAGQHGNRLAGLLTDYHALDGVVDPTGYRIGDMGDQELIVVPDTFRIGG